MNSTSRLAAVIVLLAPCLTSQAGEAPAAAAPDKSKYHLFHPVPDELLRDLSTDRPDKTESPYTVDAGRFQIEMDLATFTFDRHNTDRTRSRVESWSFGAVNLKAGLLNNVDFQVILEPWSVTRVAEPGVGRVRSDGFGDVTLRTKINLWGNDGGTTAMALMPFVKIPSSQDDLGNHAVEGGLIVPLAVELPGGWGMGLMTEVDFVQDSDGRGHHAEWINSITFSRDIVGPIGGYVELFTLVSSERHAPWVATFDAGLTCALGKNVQLDAGVNIGLTRSADDIAPFLGLSVRF